MISMEAANRVTLVVLDVDGVLTDAGYYLGDVNGAPSELLRFDIQDGVGIVLMRSAGIKVGIITGRESHAVRLRAAQLKVDAVVQDSGGRKVAALRKMIAGFGATLDEVAFVGDDIPDLGPMRLVGMPVAVGNAVASVRATAQVHLTKAGGRGAVREFADALLTARGQLTECIEAYVSSRIDPEDS
jgi:3-deoxy-D-manno-octulosonate 8-phosphate phosphatase (KDO 8-P phosphatase)